MSKYKRLVAKWQLPLLFSLLMGMVGGLSAQHVGVGIMVWVSSLATVVVTTISYSAWQQVDVYDNGQPLRWEGEDG